MVESSVVVVVADGDGEDREAAVTKMAVTVVRFGHHCHCW